MSSPLEKKPEISREQYVGERADAFERSLEIKEGLLSVDHPVTQYVQSRLDVLYPKQRLKARVADRVFEPNAMALPNGTLVITRGLLSMMENQDELDVVLCHEARHIICKHTTEFEESLNEGAKDEETFGGAASTVLRTRGLLRFHEHEADLRGLIDAMKGKTNPTAFRSIFLKIDSYAKEERRKELDKLRKEGKAGARESLGDGGDIHGSTVDRLLFVGLLAQVYDFDAPTSTVDFPAALKEHLATPASLPLEEELMSHGSTERIKTATLNELLHVLKVFIPKREGIASGRDKPKGWYYDTEDELKETMRKLLETTDQGIAQVVEAIDARIETSHPRMSSAEKIVLREALIEMGTGLEREFPALSKDIDPSFVLKKEVLEPLQPVLDANGVYKYYRKILAHRTLVTFEKGKKFDVGGYAKLAVDGVAEMQKAVRVWAGEKDTIGDPLQGIWEHALSFLAADFENFEKVVVRVIEQSTAAGIEAKPVYTLLSLARSIDTAARRNQQVSKTSIINIVYRHPKVFLGLFPQMLRERNSLPLLYLFDVLSFRALQHPDQIQEVGRELDALPSCRDIFLEGDKAKLDQALRDWERLHFGLEFEILAEEGVREAEDIGETHELHRWIRKNTFHSVKTIEDAHAIMKELGWLCDQVNEASGGDRRVRDMFRTNAIFVVAVRELLKNGKIGLAKQPKQRFCQVIHILSGIDSPVARYALDELLFTNWQRAFPNIEDLYELLNVLEGKVAAEGCEAITVRKIFPSALLENTSNKLLKHVYREIIYRLSAVEVRALDSESPSFIPVRRLPSGYGKKTVMEGVGQLNSRIHAHAYRVPRIPWMRATDVRLRTIDDIQPPFQAGTIQSALVRRATRDFDFSFNNKTDLDYLLSLASHVSDPVTRSRLESILVDKLLAQGTSAERLKLLFDDPRTVFSTVVAQQRRAIDEEVVTVDQLEFVRQAVEKNVSFITRPESIGAAVLLERLSGPISPFGLFQMLYEHHVNDRMLKKFLFQVRYAKELSRLGRKDALGVDAGMVGMVVAGIEDVQEQIITMPDAIRYALVKHLLTGPEGILHSVEQRKRLIKYFLSTLTRQEERETSLYQLLEQVGNEIAEKADADLLFFMLLPLVVERMGRPPRETAAWEEILLSLRVPENVAKTVDDYARERVEARRKDPGSVFARKTRNLSGATVDVLSDGVDVGSISVQVLLQKAGEGSSKHVSLEVVKDLSLNEFIVETCKNIGTLGTRFLQVLGYYIEGLTKEQEEAFRDVYDNTRSQNKLTAYETAKNRAPGYAASLERVDPPLGGGSLMTVYPVRLKNGEEEVMKILAPNAEHQLLAFVRTIRSVVGGLAAKDPQRYRMIPAVIDDLITWIQADIHDEAFFERDRAFKEAHHGFRPAGFEYGLYIPTAKPTGDGSSADKYVKREERVHGITLNRVFTNPEGYDLRQMGAVIAKSFAQQLVTGVVHSDIHPGNYMVGEKDGEKWVYMIDRNFYLTLSPKEQALVLGLWNQSESIDSRANALQSYFEEGQVIDVGLEFWNRVAQEMSTGDESSARRAIAQIREAGIKVPLNMTLLLKNVISLNRICKICGFSSLVEAIEYSLE